MNATGPWEGNLSFNLARSTNQVADYGAALWQALWNAKATADDGTKAAGQSLGDHIQNLTHDENSIHRIDILTDDRATFVNPIWEALAFSSPPAGPDYSVARRIELRENLSREAAGQPVVVRNVLFAIGQLTTEQRNGRVESFRRAINSTRVNLRTLPEMRSFDELTARLSDSKERVFDTLVLLAHGKAGKRRGDTSQWMEAQVFLAGDGVGTIVPANGLLTQLATIPPARRPKIVVLLVCDIHNQALFASDELIARQLVARLRIPYVFAAHSAINIEEGLAVIGRTLGRMADDPRADPIETYYQQARGEAQSRESAWLISSLTSRFPPPDGDQPSKETSATDAEKAQLLQTLEYLPILGPGINDGLLSDVRLVAEKIAEDKGFPLSGTARLDLSLVLSYVRAVEKTDGGAKTELGARRATALIEADFANKGIYYHLSQLPYPVFFTANRDHCLSAALMQRGRTPIIADLVGCLNNVDRGLDLVKKIEEAIDAPKDSPVVVIHLFGHFVLPEEKFAKDRFVDISKGASLLLTRTELLQDLMEFDNSAGAELMAFLYGFIALHPPLVAGFPPELLEIWLVLQKIARLANPQTKSPAGREENAPPSIFFYLAPDERSVESDQARESLWKWFKELDLALNVRTVALPEVNHSEPFYRWVVNKLTRMEKYPDLVARLFRGRWTS